MSIVGNFYRSVVVDGHVVFEKVLPPCPGKAASPPAPGFIDRIRQQIRRELADDYGFHL